MTSYWYFVCAADTAALESAPVFSVKVGESRRAAAAHAEFSARALLRDDYYFCVKSDESQLFVGRLMSQNPYRAFYEVSILQLVRLLDRNQDAAHVKNLSHLIRRNHRSLTASIRGAQPLELC